MNRRKFVRHSGIAVAALVLPYSCISEIHSPKYKMGYQLYSIRDEMAKDPIATLKALKAMGYQDFEIYGYDDKKGMYYGFQAVEFKKFLTTLH